MGVKQRVLTCLWMILYIVISSAVVLYNKWILSAKYFNFPFPITLGFVQLAFQALFAFAFVHVFKVVPSANMNYIIGYAIALLGIMMYHFLTNREIQGANSPSNGSPTPESSSSSDTPKSSSSSDGSPTSKRTTKDQNSGRSSTVQRSHSSGGLS
ncbi:hypothetical protein CDL15_Pgr000837 [Punica granatum]|uniref:Uncharacterized protein n=1 Tax=Punica granatum TaxID=22663 RepID=A0A218W3N7_PUNGR|nr:hypothetical protein CDL15_Pgr000837 [Punica granatum]